MKAIALLIFIGLIGCSPTYEIYHIAEGPLESIEAPGQLEARYQNDPYERYMFYNLENREVFTVSFGDGSFDFLSTTIREEKSKAFTSDLGDWEYVYKQSLLVGRVRGPKNPGTVFLGTTRISKKASLHAMSSIRLRRPTQEDRTTLNTDVD